MPSRFFRRVGARPLAAAMLLLAVCLLPRLARAADYGWFSLELPEGWRAEAPTRMAETWVLSLAGPKDAVRVRIMVGKTAGPPDAADVAGLLRAAAGVRDPLRRADGQYVFRGKDALGVDTACVVGAAPAAALYMAVLCSGAVDQAEALLAALHGGDAQAMLPQRHATRGSLEPRFLPLAQP